MRRNISLYGLFLMGYLLLAGCGDGSGSKNLTNDGSGFTDMQFGDLSVRAATTNPPVTSSGSGVTVTGLTGQISRIQLYQSGLSGKIAFASNRDGNYEIYFMNPDGTNQTRLTNNTADDTNPCWSPSGTKIAFVSTRDGNPEIYVMNADGSNQTRVTDSPGYDGLPAWSPDGSKIAFTSDRDGSLDIRTMNPDGSNQVRLTSNTANDYAPTWSPDSLRLAFTSNRDGHDEIYSMNADGSNVRRLTISNSISGGRADSNQNYPAWSPDGATIALCSDYRKAGIYDLVMIPADSFVFNGVRPLTINAGNLSFPSWSPDGKKILTASNYFGDNEIEWYAPNGGAARLTSSPGDDLMPSWSKTSSIRTLVGTSGDIGTSVTGFLLGTAGGTTKSLFTYFVSDFTSVSIKALSGTNSIGDRLDFSIEGTSTAVNFNKSSIAYLNFDNSFLVRPFTNYPGNINGLLVSFGAQSSQVNAGQVFLVVPFTAQNRSVNRPRVTVEGGVKIYQGVFPAAYDGKGKNIAPNGATEIRVDSKTGAILSIR